MYGLYLVNTRDLKLGVNSHVQKNFFKGELLTSNS